jgi:hypothetical protein
MMTNAAPTRIGHERWNIGFRHPDGKRA